MNVYSCNSSGITRQHGGQRVVPVAAAAVVDVAVAAGAGWGWADLVCPGGAGAGWGN